MEFDSGYISPYFINNAETGIVKFENARILLVEDTISNIRDLVPCLEAVAKAGAPLLIIAGDVEGEALPTLVVNNMRGIVKTAAVKAPGTGERRKEVLKEIAILTGGKAISKDTGMELAMVRLEGLGTARHVVVTKDKTIISDKAIPAESVPLLVETTDEVTTGGLVIAKEPFSDAS
ncbi:hypothetical protein [Streptomyces violascens]